MKKRMMRRLLIPMLLGLFFAGCANHTGRDGDRGGFSALVSNAPTGNQIRARGRRGNGASRLFQMSAVESAHNLLLQPSGLRGV
jgi:hypothetical protein